MRLLTKAAILGARDLPTERVAVPEWGGEVLVRGLTGAERDRFEADSFEQKGKGREMNLANVRARLVVASTVNEDGSRMFTDDEVAALGTKSAAALQRIFNVATRLSGMSDQDVEEMVTDLGKTPSDDTA